MLGGADTTTGKAGVAGLVGCWHREALSEAEAAAEVVGVRLMGRNVV